MMLLRGTVVRLAAVLPVMFLVIIAGAAVILGFAFRAEGREYAQCVSQSALLAACALMSGRALDLHTVLVPGNSERRPSNRKARAHVA